MFRRMIITAVVLLVLLLITAAGLTYIYNGMLEPIDPAAVEDYQVVEIPPGASSEIIGAILYDNGLIQNQFVFWIYVRQSNLGQSFIAGKYSLSPGMSLPQIVNKIQSGDAYFETTWFVIPEGFTVEEIASILDEKGLIDNELFLELARQPSESILESFPFLKEVDDHEVKYILEGYLFPDTYEVYPDAGEEEIIRIMLSRMDQIINETYRQRIIELNSTIYAVLTIASMVEREARVDYERSIVAGIFYNRLRTGMPLESCATIQYILGETKEYLTFQDLEIPSPYNTYQNGGLPPGPIAAPGETSITAALYPEETDFYYFNFKYDGSGEHYFSHTYQEHLENINKAEVNIR